MDEVENDETGDGEEDAESEYGEEEEEHDLVFSAGDVVQLKSGGPPMTVDELPGNSHYNHLHEYSCVWFKGATRERSFFAEHLLDIYTPPERK